MAQAEVYGLTGAQAKKRLREQGPNVLHQRKKVRPVLIFLAQFKDFLTIILLVSTVLSLIMGEIMEAATIIAIVILNAILGFFQEFRTEKTIDALKNMAAPQSRVLRDGKVVTIASSEIVVGDVFLIEAGDKVPADAEIIESFGLHVDESLLTGESVPVEKAAHGKKTEGRLYMGTIITQGRGKALTTDTGMQTEMGKIAGMLDEIEEPDTPLQIRLDQLGKYIAVGCLLICAIVSVTGILRGENILDMLMMGISLAVAAVPEGLSAIVTISLALAVNRMVKRKALIRKLHAVETLGCSSIICSDKTGTLTENKMTVKKICTYNEELLVTGDGYETGGKFMTSGKKEVDLTGDKVMNLTLTAACLCNNSSIHLESKSKLFKGQSVYSVSGDPTEIALLVAGAKAGITTEFLEAQYKKTDEIPFDSDRKCMSVFAEGKSGSVIFTKGGPDIVLNKCSHVYTASGIVPMTAAIKASILRKNDAMGAQALRVIGIAYREHPEGSREKMEEKLVFLGLAGMLDPPRKASYEAVRVCKQAGIKPIMITGDHKNTATAVAEELKIYKPGDLVLTGADLDAMNDQELVSKASSTTVFARVSPRHKLQIVRAFQNRGHVVAMTGDGVNDAPAIKEADIGVSMGVSGTDVAKEAAGVILLDDNFATLVAAVEEGRVIYKNIRKFIRYLLSCNIGEVLTMFIGMLLGLPVVLLPIQILWVNLVTDGLPAIALGMDPPDGDEMQDPPRGAKEGVFSNGLLVKMIFRGVIISLCTLSVFLLLFSQTSSLDIARTGAFLTLVLTQLIHVFECKSEKKHLFQINLFNNVWLVLAVLVSLSMILAVIYIPVLQGVFNTAALELNHLVTILLVSMIGPLISIFFTGVVSHKTSKKRPKDSMA